MAGTDSGMETAMDEPGVYELNPALPVEAICAGAACAVFLAAVWAVRSKGPIARRIAVLAMRLTAIGCATLLMLGIERTVETVRREKARLVILCDASRSLSIADGPAAETRARQAQRFIRAFAPVLLSAVPDADVSWYLIAPSLVALPAAPEGIPASGEASPIGDALIEAALGETAAGRRTTGALRKAKAALLVSDGLATRGLSLSEAAARLAGGGTRLFAVGLGDPSKEPADIEITDLSAESPVDAGGEARASATIRAVGLRSDSVELSVRCDDREISVRRVNLSEAPETGGSVKIGKAAFSFPAGAPGIRRVRAHVSPAQGELRLLNNTRFAALEVERKPFRVLLAASRLTSDYRAVASALTGHEEFQVETIADFIRPSDPGTAAEEAAAGPMAESRFWSGIGKEFRAIVWLSPQPSRLPRRLQEALAESALSGRVGIIFVLDEPPMALSETPLERLLPVRVRPLGSARDGTGQSEGKESVGEDGAAVSREIVLTEDGMRHPASALEGEGDSFWKSLPTPERPHPPAEAAEGAAILAKTAAGSPILSATTGLPRAIAVHSDEIWRWGFGGADRREAMRRAWRTWTLYAADGAAPRGRVELRVPALRSRAGEPLSFQVAVAAAPGEAAGEMRVSARLTRATGTETGGKDTSTVEVAGAVPLFSGKTPPLGAGEYMLAVEAFLAGRKLGEDSTGLIVEDEDPELEPRRPDHAGMRSAAESTGGKFAAAQDAGPDLAAAIASQLAPNTVRHKKRFATRSDFWLLALMATSLCVEWRIRRTK